MKRVEFVENALFKSYGDIFADHGIEILEGENFGENTHSKNWRVTFWRMPKIELKLQRIKIKLYNFC